MSSVASRAPVKAQTPAGPAPSAAPRPEPAEPAGASPEALDRYLRVERTEREEPSGAGRGERAERAKDRPRLAAPKATPAPNLDASAAHEEVRRAREDARLRAVERSPAKAPGEPIAEASESKPEGVRGALDFDPDRALARLAEGREASRALLERALRPSDLSRLLPSRLRRAELEKKFEIDGKSGRPNALTRAEFDRAADLYESIHSGTGNLSIDTSGLAPDEAARYKRAVMERVGELLQTKTGREQLGRLTYGFTRGRDAYDHRVVIRPGADRNGNGTRLDDAAARAVAKDTQAATIGADGRPSRGSDMTVEFNPFAAKERPDVVLCHELTHALRGAAGEDDYRVVSFEDGVPSDVSGARPLGRYEHQAVGIGLYQRAEISENAYRRERQALGRGGVGALPGDAEMVERRSYRGHGH